MKETASLGNIKFLRVGRAKRGNTKEGNAEYILKERKICAWCVK